MGKWSVFLVRCLGFLGWVSRKRMMLNDSCCVSSSQTDRGTCCEPFLKMGILSISLLAMFFFVSCIFLGPVTSPKEKLLKHGVAGMPAGAKDLWPHLQAPWLVSEG